MPIQNLFVNAAGSYTQWDFPMLDPHWEQVDEISHDGNTTYIADDGIFTPNGTGPKDIFNIDNWTHGDTLITKVEVIFWAKYSGGSGNKCRPLLYLNGVPNEGTNETLTPSWTKYTQEISKPGGGNWYYTDLNDLQVGVISKAITANKLGNNVRVTQVYVQVTYTDNFVEIISNAKIYNPYPTQFYLSKQSSDLGGTAKFDAKLLEVIDEDASKYAITVYDGEIGYAYTEPNTPYNNQWESGSFRVKMNIQYPGSYDAYLKVSGSRINSIGEVQETTVATDEQLLTIEATQTYTFDIPNSVWSSGNYSDRLRINYALRAAQPTGIYLWTGKADSCVSTSISLHGISTIQSNARVIPILSFIGLTIAEILKLINDNDGEININQNADILAEMLQEIASTNNTNIVGLTLAEIVQKFDLYYS